MEAGCFGPIPAQIRGAKPLTKINFALSAAGMRTGHDDDVPVGSIGTVVRITNAQAADTMGGLANAATSQVCVLVVANTSQAPGKSTDFKH